MLANLPFGVGRGDSGEDQVDVVVPEFDAAEVHRCESSITGAVRLSDPQAFG
jgi:hypothetical protein